MSQKTHSILAPSSKEWFYCGHAAKFLANKVEETSDASEFGSECHLLAEHYIRQSLKLEDYESEVKLTTEELKAGFKHYSEEMERLATGYANYVISTVDYEAKRTGEQPVILIEQLLEMDYAPDTHGTLDCGIIAGDTLTIIDNKTGFIKVTPFDETLNELNSQLGIYGLYAYKCYKDFYPIKNIRLVIYQERINNISEYSITSEDLEKWEQKRLIPAAKEALSEDAKANSGVWCKYCPGRNICRQRAEDTLQAIKEVNKPEFMTDEEIEALLPKLDGIITYVDDIKEYCLKKAIEGKKWKGYKVVESVTKRKISDEDAVVRILTDNGYDPFAAKKLMPISELQKMLGKTQFNDLVGGYIIKPKGQAVLAQESDAREEIKINKETK
ncbi:MAG: DUF2800 domain-containing protein [Bacilli bacterium]|jgi:hypothetical protein